jgi:hypothetical protein
MIWESIAPQKCPGAKGLDSDLGRPNEAMGHSTPSWPGDPELVDLSLVRIVEDRFGSHE